MSVNITKNIPVWCLLILSASACAEGMLDVKPYVSTNIIYDDNVFRFSSPDQAKTTFGSSATSDVMKRVDLGINVNLRLSRQLLTLSSSINESRYNRFDILDNTGRSNSLVWNWRLGNDVYGELSASESQSIAGFTEIRSAVKNLRTFSRGRASINWTFQPSWTLQAVREVAKIENDQSNFKGTDRKDDIYDAGIRYQNPAGTQLGLDFQVTESSFPNRTGFAQFFFGDENTEKELIATAAWLPTPKTRVSTRLSQVNLEYKNLPQRDFNGFSQRWSLDQTLSGKTSVNLTAYQEISPVDDVLSTYVKTKGVSISPTWNFSSKITLRAGLGYEDRDYLGSAGFFANQSDRRNDESELASLSLMYVPIDKLLVQLQYQGEKRSSNIRGLDYQFNMVNFLLRYDY